MSFNFKDATTDDLKWLWKHGGQFGPKKEDRVTIKDMLSVPNAPLMFPKVIQEMAKEAAEPLLVGTSLLNRIDWHYGQTVTCHALGALVASDIGEMEEYPEQQIQVGGATVTATIGKSGVAFAVTEETLRYSLWDVIGIHIRKAGQALARLKETKIFDMMSAMGTVVFDNVTPTSSLYGVCHGRNLQGNPNGAVTMDDVFDAFAQGITQGFNINTIIMHPLCWTMWVKDATLRSFVQANGGGVYFASWSGNPAGQKLWSNSSQGGLGVGVGQNIIPGQTPDGSANPHSVTPSALPAYPTDINAKPVLPGYLGIPFTIIVSPFCAYDPRRKLTDIILCDRNETGFLFVDEDITTEEWADPSRDVRKIKMRERYGLAISNEGRGIVLIKNAHVVPNEVVLPATTSIDISSSALGPIAPNTHIAL